MSIKKSLHKKKIDKIYFTLPLKLPSNPQFHIQPQEKKKKKKKGNPTVLENTERQEN
jgi:hypothetical protein